MKRRDFLKRSALTSGALIVPAFLKPFTHDSSLYNQTRKLVIVHLQGGNDGLNTIVPYSNETYYRKRPRLAIPTNQVIRLNDTFGFNPSLNSLVKFYEKEQMLILNNVGYPGVYASHYTASRLWETGWSNALLKEEPIGVADEFNFEHALLHIASKIKEGVNTQIYRLSLDGFDTHQFQKLKQDRLLTAYADGMNAFMNRLLLNGQLDKTLIVTYSEFGRATAENIKHGTEHGSANPLFIFGGILKHTGISDKKMNLESTATDHEIDFREVITTIKGGWFENNKSLIMNDNYTKLNFI